MDGDTTQDVNTAPSAETTTPPAGDNKPEAPADSQPAGDGVKAPGDKQEQHVPYERFREVNDKAKAAEERAKEAERRAAELEAQGGTKTDTDADSSDDDPFDPNTAKALDAWARKNGYVTKEELQNRELQSQAQRDVQELKSEFSDFDKDKVIAYAKENGLMVSSKAGLKAVYQQMKSSDPEASQKAKDEMRNQIIAELTESGQIRGAVAEKPGAGGVKVTPKEEPRGLKSRIHQAMKEIRS